MIAFTRSTDGGATFSNETVWGDESAYNVISKAKLATFGNNNVYILLFGSDGQPHPISLARSTDGGATFSNQPTIITTNATQDDQNTPQMTISKNGVIYVAWNEGDKILLKKSTDGGATFGSNGSSGDNTNNNNPPSTLFPETGCTDNLRISAAGDNNIHALCILEREETPEGSIPGTHLYLHYRVLLYTGSTMVELHLVIP